MQEVDKGLVVFCVF